MTAARSPGAPTARRLVRRAAVQALYQLDASPDPDLDMIRTSLDGAAGDAGVHEDAWTLALAAWAGRGTADRLLRRVAPQWPPSRQAATDRAILRLACHELLRRGLPPAVVIDEAVELAREFSTGDSPRFVHGVLEGVRKAAEAERAGAGAEPPAGPAPDAGEGDGGAAPGAPAAPDAPGVAEVETMGGRPLGDADGAPAADDDDAAPRPAADDAPASGPSPDPTADRPRAE